jgi:hypothetical protein
VEYASPVSPGGDSIVASHSLMPDALYHIFASLGEMMSPNLPLSRSQHEMIATMVSVENRCWDRVASLIRTLPPCAPEN